jgi:Ca-activated chloride channel homolog
MAGTAVADRATEGGLVLHLHENNKLFSGMMSSLFTLVSVIALLTVCSSAALAGDRSEIKRGNDFFAAEDWDNALAAYKQALEQGEDPALPNYNLGDVHYRQQNYEAAEDAWSKSFNGDDAIMSAQSAFNIGNARYASGDLEGALEAYITALQNNPDDRRAKYNLEQTLQQMQQQEQEEQNQDQDGESDEENQEQQSNSDQQQDQSSEQQQQESEESEEGEESQPQEEESAEEGEEQPQPDSQPSEQEEITRRQQEQLLQSLEQDEKDILRQLLKKEIPANRKVEKDW